MLIALNLIGSSFGGQLTRSKALITNDFWEKETDIKLFIILEKKSYYLIDLAKKNNHKIFLVDFPKNFPYQFSRLFWENFKLNEILKKHNTNVYLTFSHYLPFRKICIPSVLGVTNIGPFNKRHFEIESIKEKIRLRILKSSIIRSSKQSNSVVALSNYCKEFLIKNGINQNKIDVIPNGVKQKNIYKKNFTENEGKYILYVSHFYRYKNFEQVINAYNLLERKITKKFKLILVGKFMNIKYVQKLQKLSLNSNYSDSIIFINNPNQEELDRIYSNASIFVYASLSENCPNILLEALSYALPTLCINLPPMKEFSGGDVEFFEPFNHRSLSSKLSFLLNDESSLISLSKRSFNRSKNYTWDQFTYNIINLCKRTMR